MVLIISSNLFFNINLKFHSTKQIKSFSAKYTKQIRRDITTNISALLLTKLTNLAIALDTLFLKYCCGIMMIILLGWSLCYSKQYFLGLALGNKFNLGQVFLEIAFRLQVHLEPTFRMNLSSFFVFLIRR